MLTVNFRHVRRASWAAALLLVAGSAIAQRLTVSAASSLTQAFQAIGAAYEKDKPGVRVSFNFAASGPLLAQIRQGAPVDVFASADQDTMYRASAAGLIAHGTRTDFAANALVLVVPAAATSAVPRSLQDLTGSTFQRIAIGTPATVPVGRYTLEAVQQAGLSPALQARWIQAENVRQVLSYVARGEVDAGFVYRTDALTEPRVRVVLNVPTATRVTYPMAMVAGSPNAAAARDFLAYVQGPVGRAELGRFGFGKP